MAHAPARIRNVAHEPGNKVDMQVEDGLPRRSAAIDADVIAIRSVILLNHCLRGIHGADKGVPLLSTRLKPRGNMASR